jgi:hypothetical protein
MIGQLRHGDLNFFDEATATEAGISLPNKGAKYEAVCDVVLAGSHGGAHILHGPAEILRIDDRVQWVRIPHDTRVSHADRHLDGAQPAGLYAIVRMRDADGLVED